MATTNNAVREIPSEEPVYLYSFGNELEFKNLEEARIYYWNHLTRDERKRLAQENKWNSVFAEISAEVDDEETEE